MFVYKVIRKNHYSPETGAYISFGISAHDPEHGQTCFVPDVFIGESEARAFTERLNTLSKIDWQGAKIVFYRHFSTKIAVCSKRKTPDQMIRRFHGAANQI